MLAIPIVVIGVAVAVPTSWPALRINGACLPAWSSCSIVLVLVIATRRTRRSGARSPPRCGRSSSGGVHGPAQPALVADPTPLPASPIRALRLRRTHHRWPPRYLRGSATRPAGASVCDLRQRPCPSRRRPPCPRRHPHRRPMPESGRLIVCATPIGNLGDVTLRVLDALRDADTVLAEDTRVTRKLLARYEIDNAARALRRAHRRQARRPSSSSGMPAGEVHRARLGRRHARVSATRARVSSTRRSTPACRSRCCRAPSAILTALVASGLPTHAFYFGGFLPSKAGERTPRCSSRSHRSTRRSSSTSRRSRTAATLAALAEAFPGRAGAHGARADEAARGGRARRR